MLHENTAMMNGAVLPSSPTANGHGPKGSPDKPVGKSHLSPSKLADASESLDAEPALLPATAADVDAELEDQAEPAPIAAEPDQGTAEVPAVGEPEEASSSEVKAPERVEEDLGSKRLWFVRMPRPEDDTSSRSLDHNVEAYKMQVKLLNETINIKKLDRDRARAATQAAQAAFNACKAQVDAKEAQLAPLRAARDARNSLSKQFREAFGELDVRSEAELDARLKEMEYRISHESMPLNEEKRLIQAMKKLEAQRPKVKEMGSKVVSLESARSEANQLHEELSTLEKDMQVLWEERKTARDIVRRLRDAEQEHEAEINKLMEERAEIRAIQDEAYGASRNLRQASRAKWDEYQDNRRFSREVRQMLEEGRVEEARAACAAQIEAAQARLAADAELRREYIRLWDGQRKKPRSLADDEALLLSPEGKDKRAGGSGRGDKGGKSQRERAGSPVSAARRAQAVIAGLLQQADTELAYSRETKAAAEAALKDAEAARAAVAAKSAAAPHAPAASAPEADKAGGANGTAAAPGTMAAPAKPAVKPAKKAAPLAKVELPAALLDTTPFVPPPTAVTRSEPAVSAEELKERERQRNRLAREEAERRKATQLAKAEKRRAEKLKAEAERKEAALAAEKEKAAAAQAQAAPQAEESAAEESDAGAAGKGSTPAAATAVQASSVAAAPAAAPSGRGSAAAGKGRKRVQAGSIARRPPKSKQFNLQRFVDKYWIYLIAAASVVLLSALVYMAQRYMAPSKGTGAAGGNPAASNLVDDEF